MAYLRPIVAVYQEYATTSISTPVTSLIPCIVGPCYQVIDIDDDPTLALYGSYEGVSISDGEFPNRTAGADVDDSTVSVKFDDCFGEISAAQASTGITAPNQVDMTDPVWGTAGIEVGDYLTIYDDASPTVTRSQVLTVASGTPYFATVAATIPTPSGAVTFDVLRSGADVTIVDVTVDPTSELEVDEAANTFDITAPVQTDVSATSTPDLKDIGYATLYIGYKALRTDLSTIDSVESIDEALSKLGPNLSVENPLGHGVVICLGNTTGVVKFVGVDTNDLIGFTSAANALELDDNVYAIVPLTQSSSILTVYSLHATQMSDPLVGNFRIAIGNTIIPTVKVLDSQDPAVDGETGCTAADTTSVVEGTGTTWLADGIEAGDTIEITDTDTTPTTVTRIIDSIVTDTYLTVTVAITGLISTPGPYEYEIITALNKGQQATEVATTSSTFGSSRFTHVFPDVAIIETGLDDDGDPIYSNQPGYYLGCALGGMIGGLPSHQGFTRIAIAGVAGIENSNDYFSGTQLDTIAEGGTFIFVQLSQTAPPSVRHQLTTDRSTIEFGELSFVKNFDYVSILCKEVLDAFLGRYNITPSTLSTLETALRGILESLRLGSYPRIGSRVLGYDIVSVEQNETIRDRVEMIAEIDFPYALNTIALHLVSR